MKTKIYSDKNLEANFTQKKKRRQVPMRILFCKYLISLIASDHKIDDDQEISLRNSTVERIFLIFGIFIKVKRSLSVYSL